MSETIKISDISAKLGISRNTVSKALNGKYVPDKTKEAVLAAAAELGYKSFPKTDHSYLRMSGKKILLLSSKMLMNIPFHIHVMRGVELELAQLNLELLRYTISSATPLENLKSYIEKFKVDGILCIEFFDKHLIEQVLSLNLPTVFMDFCINRISSSYNYDVVMMENTDSVKECCLHILDSSCCKSFGYVGDIKNCLSFNQRFMGMREAMFMRDLPFNPRSNILVEDDLPYNDIGKLANLIRRLDLPDCFVCANDFLALMTLDALNSLEIKVPNDIMVIGFENSAESKISKPTLSTINVNKATLGKELVYTLLNRMAKPQQQTRFIYIKNSYIGRETTNMM